MSRDPRIDPIVGDVLRKKSLRREVIATPECLAWESEPFCIHCRDGGHIKAGRMVSPTLNQFRKWAASATVEVMP